MKRLPIACSLALVAGAMLTSTVGASAPRARLRGFVCQRALDPKNRVITVAAVMRPLQGTKRMALKFELLSRTTRGGAPTAVSGGDLGTWISPSPDPALGQQPGDVWFLKHPVQGLAAPARYHFRVSFRWTGADGRVIGRAVRTSQSCYQPELRPDLLVQSIVATPIPGKPQRETYVALIRNGGMTGAGPFQVSFSYGAAIKQRTVQFLGPHSKLQETFAGPVCTTDTAPTVTVDPNRQVDDYNRSNNSLVANCSAPAGSPSGQ